MLWDRNNGNDRREALALCLRAVSDPASGRFDETLDMAVLALGEFGRSEEVGPLFDSLPPQRVSPVTRGAWQAIVSLWRGDNELAGRKRGGPLRQ